MKNVVIILLLAGGAYFGWSYFGVKQQKEQGKTEQSVVNETSQEETTTSVTSSATKSLLEENFSKSGAIINKGDGWILMYDEPGRLALSVNLKFTPDSVCNVGTPEKRCEIIMFNEDKRYTVSGNKNDGELTVIKIEEFKENF